MAQARDGFVFYSSYFEAFKAAEAIGKDREYIKAMLEFAFEGKEPEKSSDVVLNALVAAFVPQIEANRKKREAGKKGGRPPKTNGFIE